MGSLMNSLMFSDAGSNADRVGGHQIISSPGPRDEPQVGTKWMAKLLDGDTLRNYTVEVKNKNDDGTYFVTFPNFPNHKGGMTVKQAQLLGKLQIDVALLALKNFWSCAAQMDTTNEL